MIGARRPPAGAVSAPFAFFLGAIVTALLAACAGPAPEPYVWDLPPGIDPPPVPEGAPLTVAKVELGRRLFYDPILSADETLSCASCHDPARAFTDGRARAVGLGGAEGRRSAMSLANVGYAPALTWANPLVGTLERQALLPLFGEEPIELGLVGREGELSERLADDSEYPARFADAFPDDPDPLRFGRVVDALAAFQRTLVSRSAPHDLGTASEAAERGRALFESERLGCASCHHGLAIGATDEYVHAGLYDVDGAGGYPTEDRGLYALTFDDDDDGLFRPPTLRNVAVTAPYMHDGSIATLDEVIDHYAAGGRARSARTDPRLRGFELDAGERADLIAFLESLTDEAFLADPRHADPFAP